MLRISPYSGRMRENADQNNSEYEHFLSSENLAESLRFIFWLFGYFCWRIGFSFSNLKKFRRIFDIDMPFVTLYL